jgi:S1-C subfamily serine protease
MPVSAKVTTELELPERAYLGVQTEEISDRKAELIGAKHPYGSYITKVIAGSAAEKAGLKALDYIIGIDQHNMDEDTDLKDLLSIYEPGAKATIHYYRNGQEMHSEVVFMDEDQLEDDEDTNAFLGVDNDDDDDDAVGIRVSVSEGSSADKMGLKDDDIITAMNGHTVIDWTDLKAVIGAMKPGDQLELQVRRNNETLNLKGPIGHEDDRKSESYGNWNGWDGSRALRSLRGLNFDMDWDRNQNNSSAFLGITLGSMSREKAKRMGFTNHYGSYVASVYENSGAQKAGIQPLDYIYGIDEYRVGEDQNIYFILSKYKVGQKVNVHLIRKGQEKTIALTFMPKSDTRSASGYEDCDKAFMGVQQSHDNYGSKGLEVEVISGTTAAELGMEDGDEILSINGYQIVDWGDLTGALRLVKAKSNVTVEFLHDGKKMSATKVIKSTCDQSTRSSSWFDERRESITRSYSTREKSASAPTPRLNPSTTKMSLNEINSEELERLSSKGLNTQGMGALKLDGFSLSINGEGLKVRFKLNEKADTEVKLYNSSGRVIYEYDLGNFSGDFSDDIDILKNGEGSYFLVIRQGDKKVGRKVSLQVD